MEAMAEAVKDMTETVEAMVDAATETGAASESKDEKSKTWGQTLFGSWG